MSTLRINNIEAKSVPASPTIDEKVKITNSSGDVLVHIDGKTSGITTIGINTTSGNIKFDANSNIVVTGIITATKFVGTIEPTDLTVSGKVSVGGSVTAATFYGSGANLTGISIPGGATNLDLLDSSGTGNGRIRLGASQDLQIYHDGSHSWFKNTEGRLILQTDGDQIQLRGNSIVAFNGAASTEYLRISSNGNISINNSSGLSSTYSSFKHFSINNNLILNAQDSAGGFAGMQNNAYLNSSGNWVRVNNDHATSIGSDDGNFYIRNIGAGTGNISWNMPVKIQANNRINIGEGNSGSPLGAVHINTNTAMGTDTALWIGDNANKRYCAFQQISGSEQFSHMKLQFNDNGSRSLIQLSNPYAPAGYGTQILFQGYNEGTQAYIETKSEGASNANSSLYIYTSGNKGLRIRHSGTVQAQEALVSRNGVVQINQVTSTTRYSGSIASVDLITGSTFSPKTNSPRFLIMIFCPVNTSDDSDAHGSNTNPYHYGRIEYRKSGGSWTECDNQGSTSNQGGYAAHIELSPNRTGNNSTDYWSGNRYRMEHKCATILATNVGDCGDGGTVQFKLRGYSHNDSFVHIGQPHGYGTDDNYPVQPWGFTVFELAPDSNSYTAY